MKELKTEQDVINYDNEKKIATNNCIFKTLTGSRLYGTFCDESDHDYKGIAIPPKEYILGFKDYQQFEDRDTDNVIYSLQKALKLMLNNNPNMLDILFAPPEFWTYCDSIWMEIYDNRYQFISKRIKNTYTCYAQAQLHRLKRHKSWLDKNVVKPVRKDEFEIHGKAILSIPEKYLNPGIHDQVKAEKLYQKQLQEYNDYVSHMKNRNVDRLKQELKVGYDTKHAMHVIRLLKQSKEIFETGEVIVDRTGIDADQLKDIRFGKWKYEDLLQLANDLQADIEVLYEKSDFPEEPDRDNIEKIMIDMIEEYYGR
jgi:hypothetical protein